MSNIRNTPIGTQGAVPVHGIIQRIEDGCHYIDKLYEFGSIVWEAEKAQYGDAFIEGKKVSRSLIVLFCDSLPKRPAYNLPTVHGATGEPITLDEYIRLIPLSEYEASNVPQGHAGSRPLC
jgi:hypothetical protein